MRVFWSYSFLWMVMIGVNDARLLMAQKVEKPNVAVSDFEDKTGKAKAFLPVVNEAIQSYLYRTKRFDLIDRANLQKVLKEKELILSGLTSKETAQEVTEILGADMLIVGSIVEASVREGNLNISKKKIKVAKKTDKNGNVTEWTTRYEDVVAMDYTFVVRLEAKLIDVNTSEIAQIQQGTIHFTTNMYRNYGDLGLGALINPCHEPGTGKNKE